jgi:hypothetical protein
MNDAELNELVAKFHRDARRQARVLWLLNVAAFAFAVYAVLRAGPLAPVNALLGVINVVLASRLHDAAWSKRGPR